MQENSATKTLILIPTQLELAIVEEFLSSHNLSLQDISQQNLAPRALTIELCGFGVIASGIEATRLIERHKPDRVLLVGIAGRFGTDLRIGEAYQFHDVALYGIGAGTGTDWISTKAMGFPQTVLPEQKPVFENLKIADPSSRDESPKKLLTVTSASASPADIELRTAFQSDVLAEDMEGFSVALACQKLGVELKIIRGISNDAGDRNQANWQIKKALRSAAECVAAMLS